MIMKLRYLKKEEKRIESLNEQITDLKATNETYQNTLKTTTNEQVKNLTDKLTSTEAKFTTLSNEKVELNCNNN